ncbi:MAG TPA: hypothetical protein VM432_08885 [Bdellovibrionales bacterium]|jgi:hypothetical protein|nr:hypothetical protein [Bdellovibrionales bacterium]
MNSAVVLVSLLMGAASNAEGDHVRQVRCTEIREEPGAPTYAFELQRRGQTYTARYLNLPGDESVPPQVFAEISQLRCRFRSGDAFQFQCSKPGASIEGVEITERKLSLIADETIRTEFKEFRAVGIEVPESFLVFRFGPAATCRVRR